MNTAEGVVQSILTREVNTKFGTKKAFSLKLDDGEFYSAGFSKPTFSEGDTVQFVYKMNGNYRNVSSDIEVVKKCETGVQVSTASTPITNKPATSSQEYWANREQRDIDTNIRLDIVGARNAAIEVVSKAVELQLLAMPKTKGKAMDAFLAAIDEVTMKFCLHPENQKVEVVDGGNVAAVEEGEFD